MEKDRGWDWGTVGRECPRSAPENRAANIRSDPQPRCDCDAVQCRPGFERLSDVGCQRQAIEGLSINCTADCCSGGGLTRGN